MKYDIIVIGAGIVGLATALKILEQNPKLRIAILEKEASIAKHQTGNNSGVIHSGIYYKPNSLKAINCIKGYHQLIAFCDKNEISYDLCGKIIVATHTSEIPALKTILERGMQNGLTGIQNLNATQMRDIEPHITGVAGLRVPQTGIVDYKKIAEKYAELAQNLGARIFFNQKLDKVVEKTDGLELITQDQTLETKMLINCAGLHCDRVAGLTTPKLNIRILPFRGEYYTLKPEKEYLVKNLIYPVPDANFPFLGVHFTRMIGGGVEAGPNAVLAYAREGYKKTDVNLKDLFETVTWSGFHVVAAKYWRTGLGEFYRSYSKAAFTKALQRLLPEITQNDLVVGGAGVRAQACDRSGGLLDDFSIVRTKNQIHVLNAPSPAATSSLSIGETIAEMALNG